MARERREFKQALARANSTLLSTPERVKYSDDQPRDERGKWTSGGGSSEALSSATAHQADRDWRQANPSQHYGTTLINQYYRVGKEGSLPLVTGSVPTNAFYGSSQIYERVTAPTAVLPGDEIHHLVGGDFLVRNGTALGEVKFPSDQGVFEHNYSGFDKPHDELHAWLLNSGAERLDTPNEQINRRPSSGSYRH